MSIVQIECHDQRLFVVNAPLIASGDVETDTIRFTFSEEWDGFDKTAVFYRNEDEAYAVRLTEAVYEECKIPKEVLLDEGFFYFGIHGAKNGTTKTSQIIRYRVVKGAIIENAIDPETAPDILADILKAINESGFVTVTESGFKYQITDVGYDTGIMYERTSTNYPYTGG